MTQAQAFLPRVNRIGLDAPFRWLGAALGDLARAPGPLLIYGAVVAVASLGLSVLIYSYNAAFWVLSLTCGFVFVAPMLAMGVYEAGRRLEKGEKPTLGQMALVSGAIRQDVAYLGLALLVIYFFWGRIAQIVYGLSTYSLHHTVKDFVDFAIGTPAGHTMLIAGTIVGGVIAFLTFSMVVVSAPMLLDRDDSVFAATATSVKAVSENFLALMVWAALIVILLLLSAATGFLALTFIFPWLGLASWRGYRDLVADRSV